MRKTKKLGLIGAGIGFCLALFMSGFAYYASSHHLAYDLSLLYLVFGADFVCVSRDRMVDAIS
jgi:hypothetical protein